MLNTVLGTLSSGVAAATGSYESIASQTLSSSQASITFSSIPSTYQHLQIRAISQDTNNNNFPSVYYLEFNGSATAVYDTHFLWGNGTAANANNQLNGAYISFENSQTRAYTGMTDAFGASIIDIHDYASTNKNKTVRAFTGAEANAAGYCVNLISGCWRNTSAISSIKLTSGNSFSAKTVFSLYGIKGA